MTNKGKVWECKDWPWTWLCHEAGYEPGEDWHGSPIYLEAWQEVLPTNAPSIAPSDAPSSFPSNKPSLSPSIPPSTVPSASPSNVPSASPSNIPSAFPSETPSMSPSGQPSVSVSPSTVPSDKPSLSPSDQPSVSVSPSTVPSASPSQKPSTSFMPSQLPSIVPSNKPSLSIAPSNVPSMSLAPTLTPRPTNAPFVLVCPQASGATQLGEHLEGVVYDGEFGKRVALSDDGKTVAVYSEMPGTTNDYIGRVQVYRFENGIWEQIGQAIEGGSRDKLGHGLSISADGSIIAISTYQDTNTTSSYANVYEYDAAADSWVQMGNTITHDRNCLDFFGFSNSLSADGTILAIGVPNYSDLQCRTDRYASSKRSGAVKVYQYTPSTNTWAQLGNTLLAENSVNDFFGYSVSLSNDGFILAVGAYLNDGANGVDSGHVRVFQYDGGNWVQNGADIDGENAEDWSGHQVSLSSDGSRVAISAPTNSGPNRVKSAQARVYESDSQPPWTTYSQLGNDMDLGNRDTGSSVSLSGDGTTVALSAARAYTQSWNGIVRLYKDDGSGNWAQTIDLVGTGDFGNSVSLSSDGSILAVGLPLVTVIQGGQTVRKAGRVCMYQLD